MNNWTSGWQGSGIHNWDFEHPTHWLVNLGLELHGCLSADLSKRAWACRIKWLGPAELLLYLRAEFEFFFYQSSLQTSRLVLKCKWTLKKRVWMESVESGAGVTLSLTWQQPWKLDFLVSVVESLKHRTIKLTSVRLAVRVKPEC